MAKRRYSITASDDEVVPVMASFSKSHGIPKKSYLAMLACDSCNTTIVGSNVVTPFCPCCSHEMHATSEDLLPQDKKTIEDMQEIATCDNCDTTIAMPKDIEASLNDHALYCPSCSSAIIVKAADSEDDDEDESSEDLDENVNTDDDALFNNENNEGSEETSDNTDSESTESTENTDTETANSETNTDGGESQTENTDTANSDSTNSESTSTENTSSNGDTVPENSLNANLISYLSNKGGGATSIVASPGRDKWFLFVDNYPVAVAEKNDASDNVQAMFNTDKFSTAWEAATGDGVTEDVLNDFGFKATTVSVPVDEAVRQTVEASVEEGLRKYNTTAANTRSRFERCFGIAAVGINKHVFKETNPIKTHLTASLKRLRVNNAEQIVANAFAEHGEAYLSGIAMKASELMDKGDETLDELAKTVDESKYDEAVVEDKSAIPNITPFPTKEKTIVEDKPAPTKAPETLVASDDDLDPRFSRMFSGIASKHG